MHLPVCLYVLYGIHILWLYHVQYCTNVLSHCTDHPRVNIHWIHCIEQFFTVQKFWATCAWPEKQFALKIFTLLNILFTIHNFWATLRLLWKTECTLNSLYWIYMFYHLGNLRNFALALRNRVCPENIHCIEYVFHHSEFLNNFTLALKNRVYPEFTVLNIYFLPFRIFEQLRACPENRVCPETFHCIEYTLCIHDFCTSSTCPEKQSLPWIYHCIEYTFTSRIFAQLVLALKTEFALIFFRPGGCRPQAPSLVRLWWWALGPGPLASLNPARPIQNNYNLWACLGLCCAYRHIIFVWWSMNFSILHWFHLMFGNHKNLFCHAVIVGSYKCEKSAEAVNKRLFCMDYHVNIMQYMQPNFLLTVKCTPCSCRVCPRHGAHLTHSTSFSNWL